jgi:hypothetical protein
MPTSRADLSKFNASQRLTREGNGEGTVYLAGASSLVGLHRGSLAMQQVSRRVSHLPCCACILAGPATGLAALAP